MAAIHVKNGFEYFGENYAGRWEWYFRPIGGPAKVAIHGGRAGAEALLQIPLAAMERYQRALQTLSDVAKAEDVLQQAQLFSETVRRPGWRPEGSSKNPQQLARSMRAAARSPGMVDRAQRALLAAQELNAQQTANPFDVKQWTTLYATK